MSKYKITLNGLEQLATVNGGASIFSDIDLPEGVDPDILIPTIFQRSNEFEVLYADPDYMRDSVKNFFKVWKNTITRWVEASEAEYNPIENYDRHETYSGTGTGSGSSTDSGTDTQKRAGYNSSTFENYEQNTGSRNGSSNYSNQDSHTSRIHGNIGVTTSVKMLEEHVSFWEDFNLYMAIADIFIKEYCLCIY